MRANGAATASAIGNSPHGELLGACVSTARGLFQRNGVHLHDGAARVAERIERSIDSNAPAA
jgi:hypothetical protein